MKIRTWCDQGKKELIHDFCNNNDEGNTYKKIKGDMIHIGCQCHVILFSWNKTIPGDNLRAAKRFCRYHQVPVPDSRSDPNPDVNPES